MAFLFGQDRCIWLWVLCLVMVSGQKNIILEEQGDIVGNVVQDVSKLSLIQTSLLCVTP